MLFKKLLLLLLLKESLLVFLESIDLIHRYVEEKLHVLKLFVSVDLSSLLLFFLELALDFAFVI